MSRRAVRFRGVTGPQLLHDIKRTNHRRLVEHRDNNYSLEMLFSLLETNLSYRNRALNKQLCWRFRQVGTLLDTSSNSPKTSQNRLSRVIYPIG